MHNIEHIFGKSLTKRWKTAWGTAFAIMLILTSVTACATSDFMTPIQDDYDTNGERGDADNTDSAAAAALTDETSNEQSDNEEVNQDNGIGMSDLDEADGALGADEADDDELAGIDDVADQTEEFYEVVANWSYIDRDETYGPLDYGIVCDVSDGDSTIDYSSIYAKDISSSEKEYYGMVNGEECLLYSWQISSNQESVKVYRSDLKYNISWQAGPDNAYDTDISARVFENGKLIDEAAKEDRWYRAQTGIWFFGICSVQNGEYDEYDTSWMEVEW